MHIFEKNTSNQTRADLHSFQYLSNYDLFTYWTLVELVLTLGYWATAVSAHWNQSENPGGSSYFFYNSI